MKLVNKGRLFTCVFSLFPIWRYLTALAVSDLLFLIFSFTMSWRHYPFVDTIWFYWWYTPFGLWITDAASNFNVYTVLKYLNNVQYEIHSILQLPPHTDTLPFHKAVFILGSTSVWIIVSFTIERYIAVCHPMRGKVKICWPYNLYPNYSLHWLSTLTRGPWSSMEIWTRTTYSQSPISI